MQSPPRVELPYTAERRKCDGIQGRAAKPLTVLIPVLCGMRIALITAISSAASHPVLKGNVATDATEATSPLRRNCARFRFTLCACRGSRRPRPELRIGRARFRDAERRLAENTGRCHECAFQRIR